MSSLLVHDLSFGWDAPLFQGLHLQLGPGWVGVVGANGAGKSTFFQLLAGRLRPTHGQIRVRGPVHLLTQTDDTPDDATRALADDPTAGALRARLRLEPATLARWATLSAGERRRWQIGGALAQNPAVLLLDEPTNHLDAEARARLISALRGFGGVGMVISHDRALLDGLTTATLRLTPGSARLWPAPYTQAKPMWEQEEAAAWEQWSAATTTLQHAIQHAGLARDRARRAAGQISASARMKDRHDSDARSVVARGRAEDAAAAHARAAGVAGRKIHRLEEEKSALSRPHNPLGAAFSFPYAPAPRPVLASVARLELRRESRIAITGPNGAGKSTLLRSLLPLLPMERVLYLPQELHDHDVAADLTHVRSLPGPERGRVLQLVAALGANPAALLRSARLSPGEARKLRLARGLGADVWALLLDEPSNHLDLPSVERLQAALVAWPGALVLISHDPALVAATTTERLSLGGELRAEPGELRAERGELRAERGK